jgi:eukaryotic-like serine/threonine-protein kinase
MIGDSVMVGGRYELGDLLGRGGMAEVRKAVDTRLGRQVAIKQLRIDLASDPTFQARFRREAQSAAGLNHPTIVAVYDTGEEPDPATGVPIPYIVMELVEGSTLRDVLRDGRKILPERALELTAGVLEALAYSHKAGIVHRDIKPANVMLTPAGGVKVMDFGIARAVADTSATMTQTAAVIGTAQYLSPEQARGETVDARSDIYSAGCLLYELLVGRPPFVGDSPVSVAYQHVREAPVPPSQLDPVITPDIDAITLRALAKNPAERYQSARDMKADLGRVLAGQLPTSVVPGVAAAGNTVPADASPTVAAPAAVPLEEQPTDELEEEDEDRNRVWLGVLIAALVALLLAVGGYGLWRLLLADTPQAAVAVAVPNVLTYNEQQAVDRLEEVDLEAEVKHVNGDRKTAGTVTAQDPIAGTQVEPKSTVTITVNDGPKMGKIPSGLEGKDVNEARGILEEENFTNVVAEAAEEEPTDAEANEVLSVNPPEGSSVPLNQKITLSYATGKSKVPVLTGKTPAQAESDAREAGFRNFKRDDQVSDEQSGVVFAQSPKAGSVVPRDTQISYKVAVAKPEPEPQPEPQPQPTTTVTTTAPAPTPTQSEPQQASPTPTPSPSEGG